MSCETSSASSMVASLLLRSSFAHPAACPYDARRAPPRQAEAGIYSRAARGLLENLSGGSPAPLRASKNPAIAGGVCAFAGGREQQEQQQLRRKNPQAGMRASSSDGSRST